MDKLENILTAVNMNGVVVPCVGRPRDLQKSEFKFACSSGLEYFFVADSSCREELSRHCWEEVTVVGLLNKSKKTLIPQKIFPKGPRGVVEDIFDVAARKGRNLFGKIGTHVSELVLIPIAVWALMAA